MTAINTQDTSAADDTAAAATPAAPVALVQSGQPTVQSERIVDDQGGSIAAFASRENFVIAQRIAKALSESSIVPTAYIGNIANCLVALDIAARTGANILMVMQNLYVIKGKPSWSAVFLIGSVNSSGRFSPLRFQVEGEPNKPGFKCRAVAKDLASGEILEGEWITFEMAKGEGWLDKTDSKWKTMFGQMARYRAASFWVKTYAPEISLGMQTAEEAEDIPARGEQRPATQALNEALGNTAPSAPAATARIADEPATVVDDVDLQEDLELVRREGAPRKRS